MKEEIKLFIQKVAEDEELQQKMQACTSPEEAYAVANSVQEGFTFEEFVETMTRLKETIEQNQELSDEDLAAAAGGDAREVFASIAQTVLFSASAAAMAY